MIPDRLHFVWIGPRLPWFAWLAIESAQRACPTAQISLWASHELGGDPNVAELRRNPRFELQHLDERALFVDAPGELPVDLLARLFSTLEQPAARANLARLLLLLRFGGIYLDTDTFTLRDFEPLRQLGAFCGLEYVVWPLEKRYGVHPYRVLGGPLRGLARKVCANVAGGPRLFDKIARFYALAPNNAVLGFAPGHPFLRYMLGLVGEMGEAERARRYRLGTHLLQQAMTEAGARYGVHALPPSAFYPLGPELSRQYFRPQRRLSSEVERITRDAYCVHWYASVSELLPFDSARVLQDRERTAFAYLAARMVTPGA